MYYLWCLSVDKNYNNENIYLYITECDENMTKSYHASFFTFSWKSNGWILTFLWDRQSLMGAWMQIIWNKEEEKGYSTFLKGWSTFSTFLRG